MAWRRITKRNRVGGRGGRAEPSSAREHAAGCGTSHSLCCLIILHAAPIRHHQERLATIKRDFEQSEQQTEGGVGSEAAASQLAADQTAQVGQQQPPGSHDEL